jgi:hypothetical protein
MTSTSIYQPYFYIIRHSISKKMYAGARWAKGCHPDEFMQLDGYTTSSNIINRIIDQEGLDSFDVLRIDTNLDGLSAQEYESVFLQVIDCSNSDMWFNKHNNLGKPPAYGTQEFNDYMITKYNVNHNTKIPGLMDKMIQTRRITYDQNPDKSIDRKNRAKKALVNKIKNGTTGKGIPKSLKHRIAISISKTGTILSDDHCKMISDRQKVHSIFVNDNPMNDPEKRKLVGLSKLGKKAFIHPENPNARKMFLPGNEPEGWVLASTFKKDSHA